MINNEKKALKLLKEAALHLQQVLEMVEEKRYCIDVIQESKVVQKYLKLADEMIMSNHLETCTKRLLNSEDKEQQLQEILAVFKRGDCYR